MDLFAPNPYYNDKNPEFVFDEGGPDCDWIFKSIPYPCLPKFIENLSVERVNTSSLDLLMKPLCLNTMFKPLLTI